MGGFLLSLFSKLNSLWKCPERFDLLSPSLTYIDRRSVSVEVRFRFGWVLAADRRRFSFASVRIMTPKHAFDEGSEESTVQRPNSQVWMSEVASIGTRLVSFAPVLRIADAGMAFFSQRPRPVSLWNEVPRTLIAHRWPCARSFYPTRENAGRERHRFGS